LIFVNNDCARGCVLMYILLLHSDMVLFVVKLLWAKWYCYQKISDAQSKLSVVIVVYLENTFQLKFSSIKRHWAVLFIDKKGQCNHKQ
jgi:heme/copper-type cytochrome/quinol oxidase subunit 3